MKNFITSSLLIILVSSLSYSQEDVEKPTNIEDVEKHAILSDKYQFGVGMFFPSKSISIGVDGSTPNEEIEFGKALGFNDNQITLLLGFDWLFAKKWKLSFEYFGLKNSNSRVLKEDVVWDELTFEEGTNVKGGIGFNIYRVYVGRIFSRGQKHEFGGGLGVHAMNVKAFMEGDVLTSEGDLSFEKSHKSITIPLPNLGLWYFYAPNTKWAFITRIDVFALSIGDFSGSLWNITPGVNYQFFKHIGMSLNYRYIDIGAKFDSSNWKGDVDIIFHGPSITVTSNF